MSLSELEQQVFAYYLANGAADLTMAPRFWPYGELVLIVEDKIAMATRKFGSKVSRTAGNVSRAFLDLLIERNGFSVAENKFGKMYRYDPAPYQAAIKQLLDTDQIVAKAQAGGSEYWEGVFAA